MRRDALVAAMVAALAAAGGCNSSVCSRNTDCAAGDMCSITLGTCVEAVVRADARTGDGGATDAAIDAPVSDAATIDAATLDAPVAIDAPEAVDAPH